MNGQFTLTWETGNIKNKPYMIYNINTYNTNRIKKVIKIFPASRLVMR
jgi:hypothetical protein